MFIPVEITNKTVASIMRRLSWAAGPGGTESASLQHWMMWIGTASAGQRHIVGEFEDWMANGRPIWAAYRALMLGRLVGLNKVPSVRPVGVGDTW